MSNLSHSLFDFGVMANAYDRWYETELGRAHDERQKALASRLLPRPGFDARLLDVGCGTGHWSRFFAEQGYAVIGLDISREMIEVARSRHIPDCRFEIGDACRLPTGNPAYQVVAAMSVLEFVSDPETAVKGLFRNVRFGGSVIIGSLNKLAPINRERAANGEEPYAFAHFFSPSELRELLHPFGRVTMRVTSETTKHSWVTPLRALRNQCPLLCGKANGAYIVAEVRP